MIVTYEETWSGKKHFAIVGTFFRLMETVNPVNVYIGNGMKNYEQLLNVEAGAWHKQRDRDSPFDTITIETSSSEAVKFVVADGDTGYDRLFTAFAQARTLTLPGNVTVGASEGAVLAAATRAVVIFTADPANTGDIALGPTGVTVANSPIVLSPGDTWREEIAASAAWRGIATAAAQTLRVLTAA